VSEYPVPGADQLAAMMLITVIARPFSEASPLDLETLKAVIPYLDEVQCGLIWKWARL